MTATVTSAKSPTHPDAGDPSRIKDGHWLAFQLLERDIHLGSELLRRLALLDIAHGIEL